MTALKIAFIGGIAVGVLLTMALFVFGCWLGETAHEAALKKLARAAAVQERAT